jgi:hypothetical protein
MLEKLLEKAANLALGAGILLISYWSVLTYGAHREVDYLFTWSIGPLLGGLAAYLVLIIRLWVCTLPLERHKTPNGFIEIWIIFPAYGLALLCAAIAGCFSLQEMPESEKLFNLLALWSALAGFAVHIFRVIQMLVHLCKKGDTCS